MYTNVIMIYYIILDHITWILSSCHCDTPMEWVTRCLQPITTLWSSQLGTTKVPWRPVSPSDRGSRFRVANVRLLENRRSRRSHCSRHRPNSWESLKQSVVSGVVFWTLYEFNRVYVCLCMFMYHIWSGWWFQAIWRICVWKMGITIIPKYPKCGFSTWWK